jgi:hypothetical protein
MNEDKIIAKVRKNRENLYAEFDFNIHKFSQYIYEQQKRHGSKLITKPFKGSKEKIN